MAPIKTFDRDSICFPCGLEIARSDDGNFVFTADLADGIIVGARQVGDIVKYLVGERYQAMTARRDLAQVKVLEGMDVEAVRAAIDLIEYRSKQIVADSLQRDKTIDSAVDDNVVAAGALLRNTIVSDRLRRMIKGAAA